VRDHGEAAQGTASGTDAGAALDASLTCENLAAVRGEIRRILADVDRPLVQDVELVATELASNACEHAETPRHLRVRRDVDEDGPALFIEAWDASPNRVPVVGTSSLGEHRGRGMTLVTSLCDDWGVRMDAERKVVWGRMRLSG
jgi:anti-sigma regulatory factor (Ser/Thr protein kinase)